MKNERVALLDKEEFKAFHEYATRESTQERKEQLKNALEYYRSKCKKQDL